MPYNYRDILLLAFNFWLCTITRKQAVDRNKVVGGQTSKFKYNNIQCLNGLWTSTIRPLAIGRITHPDLETSSSAQHLCSQRWCEYKWQVANFTFLWMRIRVVSSHPSGYFLKQLTSLLGQVKPRRARANRSSNIRGWAKSTDSVRQKNHGA